MSAKVGLYQSTQNPEKDAPHWYIKKSQAREMIERGTASEISKLKIQIKIDFPKKCGLSSGLKRAQEYGSIGLHPRFVRGGLTRTEHKPSKFIPYTGAKVGHG